MVNTTINDAEYYEKIDTDPHKDTQQKYIKSLKNYQNHLNRNELDYLENFEVKTSQFYGQPIIHKVKQLVTKVNVLILHM